MMKRAWSGGPAALLCLLVACGGGGSGDDDTAIDAASVDTPAIDAVPIDAPPPMVTVNAVSPMGPFAGAIVLVLDASDQVAASLTTDASGNATALLPPGGKVIAAQSTTSQVGFLWVAPEGGDVLRILVAPNNLPATRTATVTVPAVAGTNVYLIESPCGQGNSNTNTITYTYRELPECATHDLRVMRVVSGPPVATFYAPDQIVTQGGTLDLQARTWRALVSRTATWTGIPSGADLDYQALLVEGGHRVGDGFSGQDPPTNGMVSKTHSIDDVDQAVLWTTGSFYENNAEVVVNQTSAQSASVTIDMGAARIHDPTGATYDNNTDVLTWTESATGLAPQGAYIRLDYGSPLALFGGNGLVWNVIAPPGGTLQMPVIPAALPNHSVANRNNVNRRVQLFRHSSGAAFVRQMAFSVREEVALLPTPGTLATSARSFGAL
jgi:hypothetical protein